VFPKGHGTTGRPPNGCPVVVSTLALAIVIVAAACEAPAIGNAAEELELDSGTIRLDPGVTVADVLLRSTDPNAIEPDTVRIRTGDVVRFTAGDARVHAVAFERDRLAPAAVAFLERTGQLRSPPLLSTGARWIVSFEGAPPGTYPFVDTSRGAGGVIVVVQREPTS
jgi:plastocyanin